MRWLFDPYFHSIEKYLTLFGSGGVDDFQKDYAFVSWSQRTLIDASVLNFVLITVIFYHLVALNGNVGGMLEYQVKNGQRSKPYMP